jgi:hypothetical protein
LITNTSTTQIKKAKRRKDTADNLKKKHLSVWYKYFKPERFDDIKHYENQ